MDNYAPSEGQKMTTFAVSHVSFFAGRRIWSLVIGLIFAAGMVSGFQTPASPGNFDFSAIDRLWKIVSVLENDREPSEEDWDALVRTPGYAALIAHERGYGLDFLKRNLRFVFKPSLAGDLEKAPRSSGLRHFLDLKAKKTALLEFQAKIHNPKVWAEALGLLKAWLPEKSVESLNAPAVTFVVFSKDARGGYGPLIFDLLYAFEQGDDFKSLFAHEAFHYYRRELSAYDEGNVRLAHERILLALNWIQDEGLADQIDKPGSIFEGGPRADSDYAREYRKNMADSPRILGTIDRLLCRLEESPADAYRIGSEMRAAVPQSGHPTGYYMTRAILENGGKAELVRTYNNPFAFFYLYNAAALRKPDLPRLSNGAVAVLRKLEKLLVPSPEDNLARAALAHGVDVSAVALFGKITSLLAGNEEPDPLLWERFFDNPGYRAYFSHEGDSRARLKEAMSLAFSPSRAAELKQALERGGSGTLQYVLNHKKNLDDIAKSCDQFRDGGAFEKSLGQIRPFLPGNADDILAGASAAVIYLGNVDLRYGYGILLIDPLEIRTSPDSLSYFIRLYGLWRFKDQIRPYDQAMLTRRQSTFLDAWEEIQHRGLADLISRQSGDKESPEYLKRYDLRLKDVPRLLGETERILGRAATDPSAWREFEILQRDFYVYPGSPVGYFRATTALEVLGREALAETTGRPVTFLRLYRKAALKKGGLPAFSDESLDFLSRLENEALGGAQKAGRR
jgi:hypothetical protein